MAGHAEEPLASEQFFPTVFRSRSGTTNPTLLLQITIVMTDESCDIDKALSCRFPEIVRVPPTVLRLAKTNDVTAIFVI